ncbi:uncharacterized protein LOC143462933 [Clavelina lepadiformis]|uniref:uncharacterized protein LOC143462933 n=1 Tax=Clavelina lepadiformis TaxID=159417 RepID=UPI004040F917
MKAEFLIGVLVILTGAVHAQGQRTCLVGVTRTENGEVTRDDVTEQECERGHTTCQTKMEWYESFDREVEIFTVRRKCQTSAACGSNKSGNRINCFSNSARRKRVRVCFECCFGDLCNNQSELPPFPENVLQSVQPGK